jgi:hypothetical protein
MALDDPKKIAEALADGHRTLLILLEGIGAAANDCSGLALSKAKLFSDFSHVLGAEKIFDLDPEFYQRGVRYFHIFARENGLAGFTAIPTRHVECR